MRTEWQIAGGIHAASSDGSGRAAAAGWGFTVVAARSFVAVAVAVSLLTAAEACACPTCKDAVNTADPEGLNIARGYFYSILIMLAMPLTLVGSFGIYVWREMRRQEQLTAGAGDVVPPDARASAPHPDPSLLAPPP